MMHGTSPFRPRHWQRASVALGMGLALSCAAAGMPSYQRDEPPAVAKTHQQRMDAAWTKAGEGRTVASDCGFFGALIENPFNVAALDPQQEAEARAAQEVCYVQGFSRSVHYFLAAKPTQCRQLSNRMATAHGTALMGMKDPARREALRTQLDANIGDLVRQHCPAEASLILEH